MKKFKIIASGLAIALVLLLAPNAPVKAGTESADVLVNVALNQKTFYHFNLAYGKILQESDPITQGVLLSKLATISEIVWTQEIKDVNKLIEEMTKTKSGKAYDQIQALIANSKTLAQVDKDYLSYELFSWGSNLVYTPDYKAAVDALVDAGNKKTDEAIQNAKNLIGKVQLSINKEYLLGELSGIKLPTGTRTNPTLLKNKVQFTFMPYLWEESKVVELQLVDIQKGATANEAIAKENMFNDKPGTDEEWILMKFNLKYVSGPEKELSASDIVNTYNGFFNRDGSKISYISIASFSGERKGESIYDAKLYPGGEDTFYLGMLVKKSDTYPLIRVGTGYNETKYETTYTWFTTNPN
jgi:hypothetical protein